MEITENDDYASRCCLNPPAIISVKRKKREIGKHKREGEIITRKREGNE